MADSFDLKSLKIENEIMVCLQRQEDIIVDGYSEKGFNGYVFFGYHKVLDRRVALKFYYYGSGEHKEVQLLFKTGHTNLLRVWDARTIEKGWAYFITNEVGNGDLDIHISTKTIGMKDAIKITRAIFGVGAMHNDPNNIVHRDIKPENILLETDNVPVIADFGSIKRIPDGGSAVTGSQHSLLYQPPESVISGIYTYFSDIYQVGLVLYQLLGGYFPYELSAWLNKSELKTYKAISDAYDKSVYVDGLMHNKIKKGAILNYDSLPLFVPKALVKVIKSATNPNTSLRYQNAAEFHLALHNLGELPNWLDTEDGFKLDDWKGKDIRINKLQKEYICEKKKSGSELWRKDTSLKGATKEEVLAKLLQK
jgi:serine/threonine protein kinase